MKTSGKKALTPAQCKRNAEIAKIHIWASQCGLTGEDYREMLLTHGGKRSAGDMTAAERGRVLDHLAECIDPGKKTRRKKRYPGRPKNMDKPRGHDSRADQLGKIEALLTIGKKPWSYADGIAKRICKVDKVQWVKTKDLYKIITALRKQAMREHWDLDD